MDVPYSVWYSFPALDEDFIYYASSFYTGGPIMLRYYAMNRRTGRLVWEHEAIQELDEDNTPINRDTTFLRHVKLLDYMAPSLFRDLVIYTSGDQVVRAFRASDGEIVWERKFEYPTSSSPTVAGNRVYFGLYGRETGAKDAPPSLVCLSAADGGLLWRMDTDGAVLNGPVISGNTMLFGTDRNLFYVLEEIFCPRRSHAGGDVFRAQKKECAAQSVKPEGWRPPYAV